MPAAGTRRLSTAVKLSYESLFLPAMWTRDQSRSPFVSVAYGVQKIAKVAKSAILTIGYVGF